MDAPDSAKTRFEELAAKIDYRLARLDQYVSPLGLRRDAETESLESLKALRRETRGRIDDALGRIEAGSYGTCEACETRIDTLRLRRLPFARRCADCSKERDQDFRQHLSAQHRSIALLMGALGSLSRSVLARNAGEHVDLAGADAVAELIADLQQELREHFALEESDTYLDEIARVAPDLAKQIRALEAQHVVLCEEADAVLRKALEAGSLRERWEEIDADLEELVGRLARHENDEKALIQLALPGS